LRHLRWLGAPSNVQDRLVDPKTRYNGIEAAETFEQLAFAMPAG